MCVPCVTSVDEFKQYRETVKHNQKSIPSRFGGDKSQERNYECGPASSHTRSGEENSFDTPDERSGTETDNDCDVESGDEECQTDPEPTKPSPNKRKAATSVAKPKYKKRFHESDELDERMRTLKVLTCDLCREAVDFNGYKELKGHYSDVHNVPGYIKCCSKKFTRRYVIHDHIRYHFDAEAFKCDECGKCFPGNDNLKSHKMIHIRNVAPKFECDICQRKFAKESILKHHLISHMGEEARVHTCDQCQKGFKHQYRLQDHIKRVHSGAFKYICAECGMISKTKQALATHQTAVHNPGRQKVKCEECGVYVFNVSEHKKRRHTSYEPITCDECGKEYARPLLLRRHKAEMHNSKPMPYRCQFCDKSFRHSLRHQEHMTTHTGVKIYTCFFCSQQFGNRSNRSNHHRHKHPAEYEKWRNAKYEKPTGHSDG